MTSSPIVTHNCTSWIQWSRTCFLVAPAVHVSKYNSEGTSANHGTAEWSAVNSLTTPLVFSVLSTGYTGSNSSFNNSLSNIYFTDYLIFCHLTDISVDHYSSVLSVVVCGTFLFYQCHRVSGLSSQHFSPEHSSVLLEVNHGRNGQARRYHCPA